MKNFEDAVIFVADMDQSLGQLNEVEQKLLAMSVLEDYTVSEISRLLGIPTRTLDRRLPCAVDELSRILLRRRLLNQTLYPY
jgi:DNA-directed RNA polymerase specialized sigma24 family protein